MGRYTPPKRKHTGHNLAAGYGGLRITQTTSREARMDSTGLMAAKMVEAVSGDSDGIGYCMGELIKDPERLGACTLSLLNLVYALTTVNGTNLKGFKDVVDYNIKTLADSE